MCGFVGLWRFNGSPTAEDRHWISQSLAAMRYRGPDESRMAEDGGLLLGFNRLAIRDLSAAGSQPMGSRSGQSLMVYNGETYNTDTLLSRAQVDSATLRGTSDTEVLIEVAEKKGVDWMLEQADGIFAFAFFDRSKQELFLGRDHLGIKPLYVGWTDEMICFGSEYNAIVKHPDLAGQEIQMGALQNYLRFGFIQEGEGLLSQTQFLPHKHFLNVNRQGVQNIKPYGGEGFHVSIANENLDVIVSRAVQSQLVSDVPIGTFLSGGIDSTLVTGYASKHNPQIQAFTVGVDDPGMDESVIASETAHQLGIKHTIGHTHSMDGPSLLNQYLQSMGEPLGDFSSLVTLEVCRLAKEHMTVVLSGDGGDELFWGYQRFDRIPRAHAFFKMGPLGRFISWFAHRLTNKPIPREWFSHSNFGSYYLKAQGQVGADVWAPQLVQGIWNPPLPPILQGLDFKPQQRESATQLARTLEKRIHLQRVLLKVDRASMFHSLEVRTPLLSRRVEATSESYTFDACMDSNGKGKQPLRSLVQKMLRTERVADAPKKGFTLPLAQWLRTDLRADVEERFKALPLQLQSYLDQTNIQTMWREHQAGKDHSWMIWNVYSLLVWIDRHLKKP